MEWLRKLRQCWTDRAGIGDKDLARQEMAFLPAALEIKEKPPHPASRVTAWVLLSLFTIGLVWACVGEVDIVATAEGKIIPSGQVKQIQPYERGVVSKILVAEGQWVEAGEPLIELDRGQTGADQKRLEQEITLNRLNYRRLAYFKQFLDQFSSLPGVVSLDHSQLKLGLTSIQDGRSPSSQKRFKWAGSTTDQQMNQQLLLMQQQDNFRAELARLKQKITDKQAEQQVNIALINKLKGTLPLVTQRVGALKTLLEKKMAARVQYLELEQLRIEQAQDLVGARARNQQLVAQVNELLQQRQSLIAQSKSGNLEQLLQSDREYLGMQEELSKARDLNSKQILNAPVNGIVQELAVHTVGGVVTPAQLLMKIVPENQRLEVEAWLENKDIGFVYPDQSAEVKIHTFPFTKYGIINGMVDAVSADATKNEQKRLIYKAKVLLDKSSLLVDGWEVSLVPGMEVSVEIKIGKRLLIEYISAPLLRYKSESLTER